MALDLPKETGILARRCAAGGARERVGERVRGRYAKAGSRAVALSRSRKSPTPIAVRYAPPHTLPLTSTLTDLRVAPVRRSRGTVPFAFTANSA